MVDTVCRRAGPGGTAVCAGHHRRRRLRP